MIHRGGEIPAGQNTVVHSGGEIPAPAPSSVVHRGGEISAPHTRRPSNTTVAPYGPVRPSRSSRDDDQPSFNVHGMLMQSKIQEVEELKIALSAMYQERCQAAARHEWTMTAEFQRKCIEADAPMKNWQAKGVQDMTEQTEKCRELILAFQEHKRQEEAVLHYRIAENEKVHQNEMEQLKAPADKKYQEDLEKLKSEADTKHREVLGAEVTNIEQDYKNEMDRMREQAERHTTAAEQRARAEAEARTNEVQAMAMMRLQHADGQRQLMADQLASATNAADARIADAQAQTALAAREKDMVHSENERLRQQTQQLTMQLTGMDHAMRQMQEQLQKLASGKEASAENRGTAKFEINTPPAAKRGKSPPAPNGEDADDELSETESVPARGEETSATDELTQLMNRKGSVNDVIHLGAFPTASQWENWKQINEENIASATIKPDEAYLWIRETDDAKGVDDLQNSGPFRVLDARLGTALSKMVTGDFAKQIALKKKQLSKTGLMLKGRQIWYLFGQHFKISEAEGQVKEFEDLLGLDCSNNNLRAYVTSWEMTLTGMKNVPDNLVLETLFRKNVEHHPWIKDQMAYYYRLDHGHADRSYSWLLSVVRKTLENKRRAETRAELVPTNKRPGNTYAFAAQQGICFSWQKNGKCARGANCPFAHDEEKRGKGQAKGKQKGKGKGKKGKKGKRSSSRGSESSAGSRSSSPGSDAGSQKGEKKCHFFEKGRCKSGAQCPFKHPAPCRNYKAGKCTGRSVFLRAHAHRRCCPRGRQGQGERRGRRPRTQPCAQAQEGQKQR